MIPRLLARAVLGTAVVLMLPACRDPDEGRDAGETGQPAGPGTADDAPLETTIAAVQRGEVAERSLVKLTAVVVTAVDRHGPSQDLVYVADPVGGAHSGIAVYKPQVGGGSMQDLAPGDLVDVVGAVTEFKIENDPGSVTQIAGWGGKGKRRSARITRRGQGGMPEPVLVDPVRLAASPGEAEQYEGVLVRVQSAAVVAGVSSDRQRRQRATITGPLQVDGQLTALDPLEAELCLASLTGVLDYFRGFQLVPRSADDIAGGGEGCPVETGELCGNQQDDDHDGAADCADRGCGERAECGSHIASIQAGEVAEGSTVHLRRVVVTAVDPPTSVWVRDGAGAQDGILLYRRASAGGEMPVPGQLLDASGVVKEYRNLTEIADAEWTVVGSGEAPAPLLVDAARRAEAGSLEQHESALVELVDVVVSVVEGAGPSISWGSTPVRIDALDPEEVTLPAQTSCLARLVGLLRQNGDDYLLSLRSQEDIVVAATTCDPATAGAPAADRSAPAATPAEPAAGAAASLRSGAVRGHQYDLLGSAQMPVVVAGRDSRQNRVSTSSPMPRAPASRSALSNGKKTWAPTPRPVAVR
jgi:hypothetical protein